MNKKMIALALGITAFSSVPMMAQAGSVAAGRDAFEACRGCHTSPGTSNVYPTYYVPKVGGQVAAYTVAALKAYQKSERPHGTMMANVYDFSDKTIEDIAAYLATATGSARANANGGDAAKGKKLAASCMACHNDDTNAGATNPRLAGQHQNYLEKAMQGYQSGARKNALMQSMVQDLSEDEVKDIAAYFTSLKGLTAVK
ncbi:MAG: c-type cytochrome [Methyloprofundus sp.]|nr:c-type cytochrome [Methyloprofundus sp.]MDT8426456.1 c-type cytochrome [Methyloprofundus sp.]